MSYYLIKVGVSAFLIVIISELAKRSGMLGGLIASIPVISVLALMWLYYDTQSNTKIINLAQSIFWLVLPSLALFLALPYFLNKQINFYLSLVLSLMVMAICYGVMILILSRFGLKF